MKRLPWLAGISFLCLCSCKDPSTFTRPSTEEIGRYRVVSVADLSASSIGSECAVVVAGSAASLEGAAAAPEMILDSPQGSVCTGYLHAIEKGELILSIPYRDASGVANRKEVIVPKGMIREIRLK